MIHRMRRSVSAGTGCAGGLRLKGAIAAGTGEFSSAEFHSENPVLEFLSRKTVQLTWLALLRPMRMSARGYELNQTILPAICPVVQLTNRT